MSVIAPAQGCMIGEWSNVYPDLAGWNRVLEWEQVLGRRLGLLQTFRGFRDPLIGAYEQSILKSGRALMVTWHGPVTQGYTAAQVANGAADQVLHAAARSAKAAPGRFLLRFFGEMDSGRFSTSPAEFVACWRHVRQVFAGEGASNVEWVWCPMAYSFRVGKAQPYYPGAGAGANGCDWIAADGYAWPMKSKTPSFETIFGGMLGWNPDGLPQMAAEFGIRPDISAQARADWLRAASTAAQGHPHLKALAYFNTIGGDQGYPIDWRLDDSACEAAWRGIIDEPYFLGAGGA